MPAKELPARPNIEQYKKQAKELLSACKSGDPDAIDSIAPMAYGNLALDLLLKNISGRLVVLKNGHYDNVPLDVVTATKKVVDVNEHYNTERLRPEYRSFENKPMFLMGPGAN